MAGHPPFENIDSFIEARRHSPVVVGLLVLSFLMMFLDGYDLQTIAFAAPSIMAEWQVDPAAFGAVFGSGVFGMLVGGLLLGVGGDRYGRRPGIILSLLLCGIGSLATLLTSNVFELCAVRFITGMGIGGLSPLLYALCSEFVPCRFRGRAVAIIMTGYVTGTSSGGLVSSLLLPHFGWHALFWIGGVGPLVLAAVAAVWLPESIRFLAERQERLAQLDRLLARLGGARSDIASLDEYALTPAASSAGSVAGLFRGGMLCITPVLWIAYVCSSMAVFFMISWTPVIAGLLGYSAAQSAIALSLFSLSGAIGGLVAGTILDRRGSVFLALLPVGGAVLVTTIGLAPLSGSGFLILLALCGFFVLGGHQGLNSLSSTVYPTSIRSTGVGWALSVAKIGSMLGPVIGGLLLSSGVAASQIMLAAAAPLPLLAGGFLALARMTATVRKRDLRNSPTARLHD